VTLGKITKAQLVAKWNITGDALTQLNEIAAVYAGKTANGKADYLQCVQAGFLIYEDGTINKSQTETLLEI